MIVVVIGEKKLTKVIVPDKWKAGASNTTEGGGRKINENKLLSKKNRFFFFFFLIFLVLDFLALLNDIFVWVTILES